MTILIVLYAIMTWFQFCAWTWTFSRPDNKFPTPPKDMIDWFCMMIGASITASIPFSYPIYLMALGSSKI